MITSNDTLVNIAPKIEGRFTSIQAPLEQQFSSGPHMKKFFQNYIEKFPNEKFFIIGKSTISVKLIKNLMNHATDIWNVLKKQDQTNPSLKHVISYALSLEERLKSYLYKIEQVIQGFLINKMVTQDVWGNIKLTWGKGASFEKKTDDNHFYLEFTTNNIANFIEIYKENKLAKISHLRVLTEGDIETIKAGIKEIPIPALFMEITYLKDSKENILVDSIKLRV